MTDRRRRTGFQLMEVLVAVAIAAGPLLFAVVLVQNSISQARFNRDRATARLVMVDLSELLMGESVADLRQRLPPGQEKALGDLLESRIGRLPAGSPQDEYRAQVKDFKSKVMGRLDENIDAQVPGLARLTLTVMLDKKQKATLTRLFRPEARRPPPPPPPGTPGNP